MRTRAFRRHQRERIKNRIIRLDSARWLDTTDFNPLAYGIWHKRHFDPVPWFLKPAYLGKKITTRSGKRSWKHFLKEGRKYGEVTKQELDSLLETLDTIKELGYNERVVRKHHKNFGDPWGYD